MKSVLVYDPAMAAYAFGHGHPMLPQRFTLAVGLMRAWDLIGEGPDRAEEIIPSPASDEDLLRVHSASYLAQVANEHASANGDAAYGLGYGDTPRFPHMHEAAALIVGGTCRGLDGVLGGEWTRAFNPAGGLHHARPDRAAGFCVYNDCAVAISRATSLHPGLRVAYVDIDAHHGDGVERVFWARPDVLTLSVHESGRYLYPGTGASREIGEGPGRGFALNVPLPPHAGAAEYQCVFDQIIRPALEAFGPDVIFAQLGADAHKDDPLTHLALTVQGHGSLVTQLVDCADRLCSGRLVAAGGGGYEAFSATPRMWAVAMAALLGREVPERLPAEWLDRASRAARDAGLPVPAATRVFDERSASATVMPAEETLRLTQHVIDEVRTFSPLLATGG